MVLRATRRNRPFPGAAISPTVLDLAQNRCFAPRSLSGGRTELPAAQLPQNKLVCDLSFDAFARAVRACGLTR